MKALLLALMLSTLWGCEGPCDHPSYCSADGTTIIACDERGRHVEWVCRTNPACVEAAPGYVTCALKHEPEPLCDRTELNDFVCDGSVRKVCEYGYLTHQEDCSLEGSKCECEGSTCQCVAPDEE